MRSVSCQSCGERQRASRVDAGEVRRRALRALLIMGLASSPLIWVKLRLVTGIPRMAYASEVAPVEAMGAECEGGLEQGETALARVD